MRLYTSTSTGSGTWDCICTGTGCGTWDCTNTGTGGGTWDCISTGTGCGIWDCKFPYYFCHTVHYLLYSCLST